MTVDTKKEKHDQALHLTGGAMQVSRDITLLQRLQQVIWGISPHDHG